MLQKIKTEKCPHAKANSNFIRNLPGFALTPARNKHCRAILAEFWKIVGKPSKNKSTTSYECFLRDFLLFLGLFAYVTLCDMM